MIKKGLKISNEFTVDEEDTARSIGSGTLEVLATPRIVQLVENLCVILLKDEMDKLTTTVGSKFDINHISPTFIKRSFKIEVTLSKVEDKKLTFTFKATDQAGEIANGTHIRYIVDTGRFLMNASMK